MEKYVVYVSQVGVVVDVHGEGREFWFPPNDPSQWIPAPGFLSHAKVFKSATEAIQYRHQLQRRLDDGIGVDTDYAPDFSKPAWVLRANLSQVVPT